MSRNFGDREEFEMDTKPSQRTGSQKCRYFFYNGETGEILGRTPESWVYKKKGQTAGAGQNIYNCDFKNLPPPGKVCDVDIRRLEPCIDENHFSFHKSSPCIFLKLNRLTWCGSHARVKLQQTRRILVLSATCPSLGSQGTSTRMRMLRAGILINIECRAWARNIKYDRRERLGVVHFELMIE
ncbi:hypothetical protein HF086_007135 [Spodoptera exigua]|uniref:Uncharacterized protein n=1 Tax=Spodoptera exigua TaxID=7107 RepID=A0A922SGL5_SPOEX|nr:hypothetical protein HF086_007135 [Spodoptera exigua]